MSTGTTAPQLQLKVPSHTANLRNVRLAVEKYVQSQGFDEKACGEIGLCVNEAMANVIRHAYRGASDKPIEINAEVSNDVLTLTIRDWGQAVDASALPTSKDDLEQPGGLGLICLRTLMDDVQYLPQNDGTLLRMTRRLKRTDSGGAENKRHNEARRTMAELKTGSDLVPSARTSGEALVAAVRGEIDLHNSPELRTILLDMLQKNPCKRLVLDLSQVPYMDSSAIAVLVESLQKLRKMGGRLFLIGLQPRVKGLLEIARLDSIFVIAKDEQEAMSK
jgi:anti-anti-sigma factor